MTEHAVLWKTGDTARPAPTPWCWGPPQLRSGPDPHPSPSRQGMLQHRGAQQRTPALPLSPGKSRGENLCHGHLCLLLLLLQELLEKLHLVVGREGRSQVRQLGR